MFASTLQHTPAWVFAVLLVLVAVGVKMSFPRSVTLRRSTMLPLILLGMSLSGVVSAFGHQPLALLTWALGVGGAVLALHGRIDTSAVRFDAQTRRFQLPGSWWPLALMLSIFAVKFGVGVTLALHADVQSSTAFAAAASVAYGFFSGVFLARAMALWPLARDDGLVAKLPA